MVLNMLTFDPDECNFRPGSPPYMGSLSSSSSSPSVSSPTHACSSCVGGIITRSSSSPTHPSQLRNKTSQGGQRIIRYSLSSATTLIIQKGDITKWSVDRCSDAIENPSEDGFQNVTFDPDECYFRPGSPPYMGSSSSSPSVSSPTRACSGCVGGIITRCPPSPSRPPRVLKPQDNARQGCQAMIKFSLPSSTTLIILKGDITTWSVDRCNDAIVSDTIALYFPVNSTNEQMLRAVVGVDLAIRRAAGPEMLGACCKVPEVHSGIRCPTGEARITPGFRLPSSHVIHTVGPIYYFDSNPQEYLASAYRNSLSVAKQNNIQFIALPAISCGLYGYPSDEAATVAISTIKEYSDGLKEVHCVLFYDEIYNVWKRKAKELLEKRVW